MDKSALYNCLSDVRNLGFSIDQINKQFAKSLHVEEPESADWGMLMDLLERQETAEQKRIIHELLAPFDDLKGKCDHVSIRKCISLLQDIEVARDHILRTLRKHFRIPFETGRKVTAKDAETMIDLLLVLPNFYQIQILRELLHGLGQSRPQAPKMPGSCLKLINHAEQREKKSRYPILTKMGLVPPKSRPDILMNGVDEEDRKQNMYLLEGSGEEIQPLEQELDQIESACAAMDLLTLPVPESMEMAQSCIVSYRRKH